MRIKNMQNTRAYKLVVNLLFGFIMLILLGLVFITGQSKIKGKEPSILNHRIYIVDSGSMSPTIKRDSMIIVRESLAEELSQGDIITYYGHNRESRITHRVVKVLDQGHSFITRGDANNANDPLALEGANLIGRVVFTIPIIGKVFRMLQTSYGLAGLISLIVLSVLVTILGKKDQDPVKN